MYYKIMQINPGNENFANTAICTSSLKLAEQYYRNI